MIANLPQSWAAPRLGDICELNPRSKPDLALDDEVSFVPMNAVDERSGRIVAASTRHYREVMKGYTPFIDGDVLFAKITPCMENGKAAIARGLANGVGYGSTEFHVLRPSKLVMAEWVFFLLRVDAVRRQAAASFQGAVGQQRVPESFVAGFRVPLPPLSEQRRIVEIFQDAETIRSLRQSATEKTRELLPALYHDRFSGRHNRGVIPLENMADVVSGVALGRQIRGGGVREVPYLRVANVQAGYVDLAEVKTTRASENEVEAYSLQAGDILMTEGGDFDKLGRGCLWMGQVSPCIHQNHVFRVRPDPEHLNSHFFTQYLQSLEAKRYFLRCAKRTTNLASINLTQLKKLPVPNISLPEQLKFSREVDEVLQCQEIDGNDIADSLDASLKALAFTGKLTAEWRAQHKEMLAREMTDRDELLRSGALAASSAAGTEVAESRHIMKFSPVTLRIQLGDISVFSRSPFELSRDQHRILEQCKHNDRKNSEGTKPERTEIKTFTAAEIASARTGPLRDDIQAVESNLATLVARGLVIALSLEQRTPDNEMVYGNCYRLPVADPAANDDDDAQSRVGIDGTRDQEILRLLGNRNREETAP